MLYFVISLSVDKHEAATILCVEWLVLPLFCMNVSQSVIISLWRTVLVGLCPCWDILSLSGWITHNMLCCGVTRTKFMDSLYFCFIAHLSLTDCLACAAS